MEARHEPRKSARHMLTRADTTARACASLSALVSTLAVVLFGCAGTISYWQAWAYLGIFSAASLLITLYLAVNDPALLKRRMHGGPIAETLASQKTIQSIAAFAFIALLAVPALDRRFHWSHVPLLAVFAGDVLTAIGFYLVFLAFKENTFTSATIDVADEQSVISTGPYAIVRHPMYAGALFLFIGTPLALASCWGLLDSAAMLALLVWRLLNEELFLLTHLRGYAYYCNNVRWRLIPGLF